MALKIHAKSEEKLTCAYLENFFTGQKKSDLILESKMVELYQNNNSKQLDRPDALRKLYFIFKINKQHN